MGLAEIQEHMPEPSVAVIGSLSVSSYITSTGIIGLYLEQLSPQPGNNLEIRQSTGTRALQNVFGIPVEIEIHEDVVLVTDCKINMYGVGDSIDEAIEDYKASIKAYFEELQEHEKRLGSNLKYHLYFLRSKLTHSE
jgi:hypothetical protein